MKTLGIVLALWLYPLVALSGGIDSGGGELHKDAINPWFLPNTADVTYCIIKDPTFEHDIEVLDTLIQEAIQYWKREVLHVKVGDFDVATQTFQRENCHEAIDIRFQFGTLSNQQRESLGGDPREFVAFAKRTGYDPIGLRGKGYVYVSPDNGPERYRGDLYTSGAWHRANGSLLQKLLIHEMGHIFGIQHAPYGFMDSHFPEILVSIGKNSESPYLDRNFYLDFFTFNLTDPMTICTDSIIDKEFFGLPEDLKCIRLIVNPKPSFPLRYEISTINFFFNRSSDPTWKLFAKFRTSERRGRGESSGKIYLFLTPEERVFPSRDRIFQYWQAEEVHKADYMGILDNRLTTKNAPLLVSTEPNRLLVTALKNGSFKSVLFFGR